MRLLVVTLMLSLVCVSADAKPRKRARHAAATAAATHVVPNDRAKEEHARAEAELSDLRAGRVESDAAANHAEPAKVWAIQENDKEVPANLRQKK